MSLIQVRAISTCLILSLLLFVPCHFALAEQVNSQTTDQMQAQTQAKQEALVTTQQVESTKSQAVVTTSQSPLAEKILITKSPIVLRSILRKRYSGYKITLQNNTDIPVEIVSANVLLATDGQQAYSTVRKNSKGGMAGILGGGLAVGLVTLGVGFALALIATPIYWGVRHSKNKKAKLEALPFANQSPIGTLNPGDEVSMTTLIPFGNQPFVEATLRDTKTGKLFALTP